jgi:hypothetical protein
VIEHMEDTLGLLFRYIKLLQNSGTPKWIFDEVIWFGIHVFIIKMNNIAHYQNQIIFIFS